MIVRRSRRLHISVRQFEWIEVGAEIEFDRSEVDERVDVSSWADARLTELLATEVDEAAAVAEGGTFIAEYRYTEGN